MLKKQFIFSLALILFSVPSAHAMNGYKNRSASAGPSLSETKQPKIIPVPAQRTKSAPIAIGKSQQHKQSPKFAVSKTPWFHSIQDDNNGDFLSKSPIDPVELAPSEKRLVLSTASSKIVDTLRDSDPIMNSLKLFQAIYSPTLKKITLEYQDKFSIGLYNTEYFIESKKSIIYFALPNRQILQVYYTETDVITITKCNLLHQKYDGAKISSECIYDQENDKKDPEEEDVFDYEFDDLNLED